MELEGESEKSGVNIGSNKEDPYRFDPIFESRNELNRYFGYPSSDDDVSDIMEEGEDYSREESEYVGEKEKAREVCECDKCDEEPGDEGVLHRCCCITRQTWEDKLEPEESVKCLTDSEAFKAVTNPHSIRLNLKIEAQSKRKGKHFKTKDPPTNELMRIGA